MDIYSITEARKKLGELVNQVKYQKKVIAIGQRGHADVYLVASNSIEQEHPLHHLKNQQSARRSIDIGEQ